jgi:hypothetical protein
MAIRTHASKVREIIETDPDLNITPFIRAANIKIDWLVGMDTGSLIDAAMAAELEAWVAAHYYAVRDQQYQSKATGKANAQFQGQTAMVLMSTYWGQMACDMDPTGLLAQKSKDAEMGQRRIAGGVSWMGTDLDDNGNAIEDP